MRLLVLFVICVGVLSDCPCFDDCENSAGYQDSEGLCFRYYWSSLSWEEANNKCQADGGGLVTDPDYIRQHNAITDTWIGAKETTEGLQFTDGTPVPTDLIRLSGVPGDCAFLLQGGIYSWSGCSDSLGFVCQKTSIVFPPTTLVLSAAQGLRSTNTITGLPVGVMVFLTSKDVCGNSNIRDFNFVNSPDWSIPHSLTPGTNYTLCWYGPVTAETFAGFPSTTELPAAMATGVVITVDPLPVITSLDTKPIPAAILPFNMAIKGLGLQRDAFVGYDCDVQPTPLFVSKITPSGDTDAGMTIPSSLAVGSHRVCVASLVEADTATDVFFTQTEFEIVIQPRPQFFAQDVFLPYSKTFPSSERVVVSGVDLDQNYIHIGYSVSSSCQSLMFIDVLVEVDGVFGSKLPSGLQTGIAWYLCYAVYEKVTIEGELQFTNTGIRVLLTPKPKPDTSGGHLLISHPEIMNQLGYEISVKGRNFNTRESNSDLFLFLAADVNCNSGHLGFELTNTNTIEATGVIPTGTDPGSYFICVSVGNELELYPTNLQITVTDKPDLSTSEIIPVSAITEVVRMQPPESGIRIADDEPNGISVAGLLLSLSESPDCDTPSLATGVGGDGPLLDLTPFTMLTSLTDLHLCWGYNFNQTTTVSFPTAVIYRIIPSSIIPTNQFNIEVPYERDTTTIQVKGSFMTHITTSFSIDELCTDDSFSAEYRCDSLFCSTFEVVVPTTMPVGSYFICVGDMSETRVSVGGLVVLVDPVFEEINRKVDVKDFFEGFTVPISANGLNSFLSLAWADEDGLTNATFSQQRTYTFPPRDSILAPGSSLTLYWKTSSMWHATNQLVTVSQLPSFNPAPPVVISTDDLIANSSLTIHVDVLNPDNQVVYYKLCRIIGTAVPDASGCLKSVSSSTASVFDVSTSDALQSLITSDIQGYSVCWSMTETDAMNGCSSTQNVVQFPIINPFAADNTVIHLTYGESLTGVDFTSLSESFTEQPFGDTSPLFALQNSMSGVNTPLVGLSLSSETGRNTFYRNELPIESAGIPHNVVIKYTTDDHEGIEFIAATVVVTWSLRPTFESSETTVSRLELLSMFNSLQGGDIVSPIVVTVKGENLDGIVVRIGCGPIPQPLGTSPSGIDPDSGRCEFTVTNNDTSTLLSETYPLCWAPIQEQLPDWTLGGVVEGVVITFEQLPKFTETPLATIPASVLLDKTLFNSYTINLEAEAAPASSFNGVKVRFCQYTGSASGFVADFEASLTSPELQPFDDMVSGPSLFKSGAIQEEQLCWSVTSSDFWYPTNLYLSTEVVPAFVSSEISLSSEMERVVETPFLEQGFDQFSIISSMHIFPSYDEACQDQVDSSQISLVAPVASLVFQPFLFTSAEIFFCMSPIGSPPEIITDQSIVITNVPAVTKIKMSLPWTSSPTFKSVEQIPVVGTSLQNMVVIVSRHSVGCTGSLSFEVSMLESILSNNGGDLLTQLEDGEKYVVCEVVGNSNYLTAANVMNLTFRKLAGTEVGFLYEKSKPGDTIEPVPPPTAEPTAEPTAVPTNEDPTATKTVVSRTISSSSSRSVSLTPVLDDESDKNTNTATIIVSSNQRTATAEVPQVPATPTASNTLTVAVPVTETLTHAESVTAAETGIPSTTVTLKPVVDPPHPVTKTKTITITTVRDVDKTATPLPPTCPSTDDLGRDISTNCFNNFNEAGRLVGCLRSMALTDSCLEQYARCSDNVIGDCDPVEMYPDQYKIASTPLGIMLGLSVEDFTRELFTAAVADSLQLVPSVVNITTVREGSVEVQFQILGLDGDTQMAAFQKLLATGENPFELFSWEILEYNIIETPSPTNITVDKVSDNDNDKIVTVLQIVCVFAAVVGFGLGVIIYLLWRSISQLQIHANLRAVHHFSGVHIVGGTPSVNDLVAKMGKPLPQTPGDTTPVPNPPTRLFGSPADEINNHGDRTDKETTRVTNDISRDISSIHEGGTVSRESFSMSNPKSDFLTDI